MTKKIIKRCANCSLDTPENRDHDGFCRYDGIERILQDTDRLDCPHWLLKKPDSNFVKEVKRKISESNYLEMIQK